MTRPHHSSQDSMGSTVGFGYDRTFPNQIQKRREVPERISKNCTPDIFYSFENVLDSRQFLCVSAHFATVRSHSDDEYENSPQCLMSSQKTKHEHNNSLSPAFTTRFSKGMCKTNEDGRRLQEALHCVQGNSLEYSICDRDEEYYADTWSQILDARKEEEFGGRLDDDDAFHAREAACANGNEQCSVNDTGLSNKRLESARSGDDVNTHQHSSFYKKDLPSSKQLVEKYAEGGNQEIRPKSTEAKMTLKRYGNSEIAPLNENEQCQWSKDIVKPSKYLSMRKRKSTYDSNASFTSVSSDEGDVSVEEIHEKIEKNRFVASESSNVSSRASSRITSSLTLEKHPSHVHVLQRNRLRRHVVIMIYKGEHKILEVQVADMLRIINQHAIYATRLSPKYQPDKVNDTRIADFSSENVASASNSTPESNPAMQDEHLQSNSYTSEATAKDLHGGKIPSNTVCAARKLKMKGNSNRKELYSRNSKQHNTVNNNSPSKGHSENDHDHFREYDTLGILTYRDCRQAFTDVHPIPSIEIRQHVILVCLPPVTCFILHDKVYLLVNEDLQGDQLIFQLSKLSKMYDMISQNYARRAKSFGCNTCDCDVGNKAIEENFLHPDSKAVRSNSLSISNSHCDSHIFFDKNEIQLPKNENSNEVIQNSSTTTHKVLSKNDHSCQKAHSNKFRQEKFPFEFAALECIFFAAFQQLNADILYLESCFDSVESRLYKSSESTSTPFPFLPTSASNKTRAKKRTHSIKQLKACLASCLVGRVGLKGINSNEGCSLMMDALHALKEPIRLYMDRVQAFDKAFDEILANPNYLQNMELTKAYHDPNFYEMKAHKMNIVNPDLEVLLEYFDQEMDQFRVRVSHLKESVENAERLLSIRLSVLRNRMIQWDLGATIIAAGLAFGTCVSGLFGMNLENGYEDGKPESHIVFVLTAAAVTACVFLTILLTLHLNRTLRL